MAEKPRNLILSDEVVAWLKTRAQAKGTNMSVEAEAILQTARAQEAGATLQQAAMPALEAAIGQAVQGQVDRLVQVLMPVLDVLTLETVRARMTGEEHLAYAYDGDNLVCPHCKKRYRDYQSAATFAQRRSAVIAQKARDILAAGKVPRLRVW